MVRASELRAPQSRASISFLFVLPLLAVALLAVATVPASYAQPVAGAESLDGKLPRDAGNVYGKFDNGFKYIVRPHTNPPGRAAFFLHVDTGALNEKSNQNGMAHFLEHMAFNGSTNFAPGELIPFMNQLGMSFGADSNAHTNQFETVYKLFMPDNKPETTDKALTIFSDYAYGLLMKIEEIDKERLVILEEKRSRKGVGQRLQETLPAQALRRHAPRQAYRDRNRRADSYVPARRVL